MNRIGRCGCAAAFGLLFLGSPRAAVEDRSSYDESPGTGVLKTPESTIENWPEGARATARMLIAKYDEPDGFDDDKLVWKRNGPWLRTVVYRRSPRSLLGLRGGDVVEQSIVYAVPDDEIPELGRFDGRVKYDKASRTLSSLAENENINYLSLNLADEIVTGKRSPSEARYFYRKTLDLSQSGKSSAYMDGLLFRPGGAKRTR